MELGHDVTGAAGEHRTSDVAAGKIKSFSEFNLKRDILRRLTFHNFVTPTRIQAAAIPMALADMDLLIQSKSGTGKTLIYVLTALQQFSKNVNSPQCLIVVPTRELAIQVEDTLNGLGDQIRAFLAVSFIGGTDVKKDRQRLTKGRVIVGTPGRLQHLLQNNCLDTSRIRLVVLDEADQLYGVGQMRQVVEDLMGRLPQLCQKIACSATFENSLDEELAKLMCKPMLISNSDRGTVLLGIRQFVIELPEQVNSMQEMQAKLAALQKLFPQLPYEQAIFFASSQMRADSYCNYLLREKVECELITGAMKQKDRLEVFQGYRHFTVRTLIATDLMARGVDSAHANLVINLDLPKDHVNYLHRIGRAGRFGSKGIAVTLVSSKKQVEAFKKIISDAGTGMSVMYFPLEKQEGLDIWNFDSYDFPYFAKSEAFEEDNVTKRRRKCERQQDQTIKIDEISSVKAGKDKADIIEPQENVEVEAVDVVKIVEEIKEQDREPSQIHIPEDLEKSVELNNEKVFKEMELKEPELILTATQIETQKEDEQIVSTLGNKNVEEPETIINEKLPLDTLQKDKDREEIEKTNQHAQPESQVLEDTYKISIVFERSNEDVVKEAQETVQGVMPLPQIKTDLVPSNETKELESNLVDPIENKENLNCSNNQIPQVDKTKHVLSLSVNAETCNELSSMHVQSEPLPLKMPGVLRRTFEINSEFDTKTYCLAVPTECSSTTLQPLGISNTVDDASSIISDSMIENGNGYASDDSYQSFYTSSDEKLIWEQYQKQQKTKKKRNMRRLIVGDVKTPKSKNKKCSKRRPRSFKSKKVCVETDDDIAYCCLMPTRKYLPLLDKFVNKESICQYMTKLEIRNQLNSIEMYRVISEYNRAIQYLYYPDSDHIKLKQKPQVDNSASDTPEALHFNSPAEMAPQPPQRLSVYVNGPINILPAPAAVAEDHHDDSDSWTDSGGESERSASYSSSGFAESNESASSGIDTSQYSTSSSTFVENFDEEVEEEDFDYDEDYGDDGDDDGDDEEDEDEDEDDETGEELSEEESLMPNSSSAGSLGSSLNINDNSLFEAKRDLQIDKERWEQIYMSQFQCISNYVACWNNS